jgi:tetratricopeptide (TPR) repeat protein
MAFYPRYKMKQAIFIIAFFSVFCGSFSQTSENVDSLKKQLLNESLSDTARVNLLTRLAEAHQYIDREQMRILGEEALEISEDIEYQKGIASAYNNLGTYYRLRGFYDKAIDYYFSALRIMEDIKDEKGIARCYNLIGILYYVLKNYDLSLEYYQKALEMNYQQNDKKWIAGNSNNVGMIYQEQNEYEKALEFYMKSLEMNLQLGNKDWIANNYGNIGSLYQLMGNEKSLEFFEKRLAINKERNSPSGIAFSNFLIGNYHFTLGEPGDALPYLLRAYELADSIPDLLIQSQTSEKISEAYQKLGEYRRALEFEKLNKIYEDSLKLADNTEKVTRLQMQYSHQENQEMQELNYQKSKMIQTAVAVVLLSILSFTLLILNRQRIRSKQIRLIQSKLEIENRLLQEELDFKEKMLQENIKYLLDINELLASTISKFNTLKISSKPENRRVIKEVISILQSGINDDIWREFEVRFNQIHRDFYQKLNARFPDLTPNEKKLCAFLKLNMTTKEIASITSLSTKSIETARSRLRKKLNIENKSMSLSSFFENF